MANCTSCGAELKEGLKFCTSCGAAVSEISPIMENVEQVVAEPVAEPVQATPVQLTPVVQPAPVVQPTPVVQPVIQQDPMAGTKYELISTWGYIGISLLMCIPVVGQILMIVWACGGCRKLQKRNYARAMLIMFAISLVLSLIFGFVAKKVVNKAVESIGIEVDGKDSENEKTGIIGKLLKGSDKESQKEAEEEDSNLLTQLIASELGNDLADGSAIKEDAGSSSDMASEMEELGELLNSVEALSGGEFEADDIMGEIEAAQKEAEKYSDGWPSSLPDYPDGQMTSVADYRTEISGTSQESFDAYIDTLKKNGFTYDDFYDFGMSEEDMLSFGGWWGTDGDLYVSLSYYDGVVTVDHLTELPDYSNLFGE